MGEFATDVLDALRTPLEEGVVRVARARARVTFPARFLLVAAMNPCPCGAALRPGACRCSDAAVARYARRLSGPLLDRFDLRLAVSPPEPLDLLRTTPGESSAAVAERVHAARERALVRGVDANAELSGKALEDAAPLEPGAHARLEQALRNGWLTGRGLSRVRCVALTLQDLEGRDPPLDDESVSLALHLRVEPHFTARRMAS
jgi:magnesium chelatase family protein